PTTPVTWVRLETLPPTKSAAPQEPAAARLRHTTASSEGMRKDVSQQAPISPQRTQRGSKGNNPSVHPRQQSPCRNRGLGIRTGLLLFGGLIFASLGVLAAEALDAARGIQKFLLAGEERMAVGADFYVDVAPMGGAGSERMAACALHANLVIIGMNGCFHISKVL